MNQNGIRKLLEKHPLIPVVNITDLSQCEKICETLLKKNISCIEITLRSEKAMDAIALVKEKYGEVISVGVGTLVNTAQVRTVATLGVDFLVSPGASKELVEAMKNSKVPFLPGVMTPSEIIEGMQLGMDTFKLFPANVAGGINALKAYSAVFSNVKFCPTGGIGEENYKEFQQLENVISIGGSWLAK